MSGFAEDALRADAFLGGRLKIWQPLRGYRAGIDPVLLAASLPVTSGESVLELGCGNGVALLCVAARVSELKLTGVERQADYADLARRNGAENDIPLEVITADLRDLPSEVRQTRYDHVIANPPYFVAGSRTPAAEAGREAGLGEETALQDWVHIAAKRTRPGGYVSMIQRADRLADLLVAMQPRLGSIEVLPIAPRVRREATLVLVRARAGGKGRFRLHAPLVLHSGEAHEKDGESYRPEVQAVLRECTALGWPR
ncbi:tRNA1(Val) A37 N6-methylase TrmN6 [Poseidonocella pacifica]|uniref:tRNA1(Val) A37 N6-methylase TrmN6 n=1 Tax=Poseidonocella pacifica TaxID=871651 RepID=A0A1I0WP99_9RHOB|nr:methyltransferase [Poseidonocella pacifica]SFA90582.1 tRNA1(Val) A37 N6-methylase TrmN6 [Poseidonocella pacifica]